MTRRNPSARWVLPEIIDPPDRVCYIVEVPNERAHIAAFLGVMQELASGSRWADDPQHKARLVAKVWRKIADNLRKRRCDNICPPQFTIGADGGDDFMLRQNPDNPCELQTSVDGVTWCTWADLSLCIPAGNQPGSGAEQPPAGGGQACYHAQMAANNQWLLPTSVSTGDVLDLTNANGATNDGGLPDWRCPNGQQFFLGACVGGTKTDGGDPLPSDPHLSLIVNIDGTFYPSSAFPITVPGGVSSATVFFQVNDSGLSNNSGSLTFDVCVTNNATASWTHTFDFTVSDGGWVPTTVDVGPAAIYVPGVGWDHADFQSPTANYYRGVDIVRDFSSRELTLVEVHFNVHGIATNQSTSNGRWALNYNAVNEELITFADTTEGDDLVKSHGNAGPGIFHLRVFNASSYYTGGATYAGSARITKIIVSGLGTDPF